MPQTKTPATRAAIRAEWNSFVLEVLGVNKEDFHLTGLDKLTPQQLSNLLSTAIDSKLKTSYSCGAPRKSASEYDKVKVFLSFNDKINVEVKSGVLQGVRNIPDVLIVYEQRDADIYASVLAMEEKTNGGMPAGFSAALVYSDVCSLAQGGTTTEVDDLDNAIIMGSASVEGIVALLVSSLDAQAFEHGRKLNAMSKKYFVDNGAH